MTSPARALWDAPAASPPPPRRVWRDWVLVAVLPPLIVLEATLRADVAWRWLWAVVLVALVPTLLWRRIRPFTMLAISFGVGWAAGLATGGDPQLIATAYFLILVYAVMRWGSGRAMLGGAALVLVGTLVSLPLGEATPADVIGGIAVVATTMTLGIAFRQRAAARARELDRVRLLEREQFARDLHDTVAHHVSAIAIQAQAGSAVAASDPAAAIDALRVIEGEASRTLDEMRSMVGVLRRADAAELAPTPGIADVRRLARVGAGAPGAGGVLGSGSAAASPDQDRGPEPVAGDPSIDVRIDGDPDAVPPAVGAAVFRIVQEAVTNARRHARDASRIEVRVRVDADGVRVDVRDDGAAAASVAPGFGLTGMAERAAVLGGTCTAGPAPDGRGWAVGAVLPRSGWSA
ncbi:two-component sensor histidine kinase [Agromyces luteolus]|nr:histidine kinase [Agromyces luteolus]GLK27983.1 two-component sensor histidine kinase [Agromyces luteolus]